MVAVRVMMTFDDPDEPILEGSEDEFSDLEDLDENDELFDECPPEDPTLVVMFWTPVYT